MTGFSRKTFCLFFVALALDRATKAWALSALRAPRAGGLFSLSFNRGISFSFFETMPHLPLLAAVAGIGLLALLCALDKRLAATSGMALLWAGAAGNLADRLRYGGVVDWLYLGIHVNLADLWLCLGCLLFLINGFKKTGGGCCNA